jgi:hypothetical protein
MTKDRRSRDRRADRSVQFETRRREERRDYPRFDIALDVREPHGRSRSCFGDLSPEGAAFITTAPPMGDVVLLRMNLPNVEGPIVASGRVLARTGVSAGVQVSVRFTEIDIVGQLAIAEWAQDRLLSPAGHRRQPLDPPDSPHAGRRPGLVALQARQRAGAAWPRLRRRPPPADTRRTDAPPPLRPRAQRGPGTTSVNEPPWRGPPFVRR